MATGAELEFQELVVYANEILSKDGRLQEYFHKNALRVSYGDYPESIRYKQFCDDQEQAIEPVHLQFYWSTYSSMVQSLQAAMAVRQFYWFK